jgi:arylsulfatase
MFKPMVPRPVNLRNDPFEQNMDSPSYPAYAGEKLWTVMPAGAILQQLGYIQGVSAAPGPARFQT